MAEQLLPGDEPVGKSPTEVAHKSDSRGGIEVAEDLDPSQTIIDRFKNLIRRSLKRE